MKKVYIVCLFILSAAGIFYISYRLTKDKTDKRQEQLELLNETEGEVEIVTRPASYEEIKITNITTVKLQINDLNNNTFEEKEIDTPVEFLEMERSDLLEYMKEYLEEPSEEDEERGLTAFELVEFSKKVVVLRKTFEQKEIQQESYRAVLENGYVTIYMGENKIIYDYTDIFVGDLPDEVKNELEEGIIFDGEKELYEFLETYSS